MVQMTARIHRFAVPALFVILVGVATVLGATVIHHKPSVQIRQSGLFAEGVQQPAWVAQRATLVIEGSVQANGPAAEGVMAGGRKAQVVYTDTLVKVDRVVKNLPPGTVSSGDTIRVRTLGGTVGRTTMASELYPTFTPGQSVLLFLTQGSNDPVLPADTSPYYAVVGAVHGAFMIMPGNVAVRPAVGDHYPLEDLIKIAETLGPAARGQ